AKYQHQLSTGKKLIRPSDDPIAANRSQQLYNRKLRTEQYARNNTMASSWLTMADSVLSDYHSQLIRLKELAIQQG
ncbi:MAG: flagellar hook-associated protein FlgL, partial [Aliifodinibius sp.]|nr:flagellar hook-associated protein FlgL [candidate division Zixibacteria bacterium]NIT55023.1 flagellar hook-associated protein FlgL [Fodinibius sp.]NIW43424.1 flagellar hook-associated protein FlgL [Gammaproteobacteria bacterium]NIS44582.1 flagellar hook-associated protein FlgL [candidate division Zixibacteria bacterium]NIU12640.1 flagellar hook-associated protein FlgL [candidate division Zixibacteria bacterium]